VTDDKVQAYLEMVLVHDVDHDHAGLTVVEFEKDGIKEGVVVDVGPDVPTLEAGDTVFYCAGHVIEDQVAVHYSDIVAFKRLYAHVDA
jgi:hypothetical protein